VRALKTGTAARKVGAAQVLQHALAPLQSSLELYELQVIPALVAACSTGKLPFPQWTNCRLAKCE
jgi:hypothetical protein